VAITVNYGASK